MVTIEVGGRDGRMLLVVEDNGPGFGCLPGRSGLGLSAVARQAVEHQGRLECGRGNLGGGRVSLWLPLAEARFGKRDRRCDLFCVTTTAFCAKRWPLAFQARGHRVLAITTRVTDGIAAVATHRPDACLLDLRLPDGSGLDAARVIRRCCPDTKILVLSCLTDPWVLSEAKKIGVAGFSAKTRRLDTISGRPRRDRRRRNGLWPQVLGQAAWRTAAPPRGNILGRLRRARRRSCGGSSRARAPCRWPSR